MIELRSRQAALRGRFSSASFTHEQAHDMSLEKLIILVLFSQLWEPAVGKTTSFCEMQSKTGRRTLIGHDFSSMFEDLALRGDADVAIVSTEEGFSPLGGSRKFFENDLQISYNDEICQLARWNQDANEHVTLIAFASRNPKSLLKGIILAPGENCRSYLPFASRYGRPHRDYYYNVSYEAIRYACHGWGARKIAISHLSACGRFHMDMATCHVEALAHFCDEYSECSPSSLNFCECCISESHLQGVHALNQDGEISRHRSIHVASRLNGQAVLMDLDWRS